MNNSKKSTNKTSHLIIDWSGIQLHQETPIRPTLNTIIQIQYGKTFYFWINKSKKHVEKRFQEIIDEQQLRFGDSNQYDSAIGLISEIDDSGEFFIWTNPQEEIEKMLQNILENGGLK